MLEPGLGGVEIGISFTMSGLYMHKRYASIAMPE